VLENPLDFAQHCSTEKAVREASVAAAKQLNEFSVECSMRKDLFDSLVAFKAKKELYEALSAEKKRYVDREITIGRQNGLHLDEELRKKVKEVKKEISDLGTTYSSNLNEDQTFLEFNREELAGVPQDLVDTFQKVSIFSHSNITWDTSLEWLRQVESDHEVPSLFSGDQKVSNFGNQEKDGNCLSEQVRSSMKSTCLYWCNCTMYLRCIKENTPILERMIELREKQAKLLGYENHASYITEVQLLWKAFHYIFIWIKL